MSSLRPVAVYGLTVPVGEEPVPAFDPGEYPATFKLTMAALNPFEVPEPIEGNTFTGATLKIIRIPGDDSDEEDSDGEDFDMAGLLDGTSSDEDEDDEEVNGGPSDPEKSSKARKMAVLKEALASSSDDMDVDGIAALSAKDKGKGKAVDVDLDDESEDGYDEEEMDAPEEFVLCTLDPTKTYQQSLDITINEHERVYFQVSGTHTVYLTGNILIPEDGDMYDSEDEDEDDEDYDLTPDDDELDLPDEEDESDELDDIDDPRITEVGSDEEAAVPKLVKAEADSKKGKNKRHAPESEDEELAGKLSIDEILAKTLKPAEAAAVNGEQKLSKKQQKKLKNNAGNAVEPKAAVGAGKEDVGTKVKEESVAKPSPGKGDKKSVQFAKTLVQGPSSTSGTPEAAKTKPAEQPKTNGVKPTKAGLGVKVVNGVTIDDKKLGSGPAAKKGDKVSMRYIGKLDKDKKVFDSNKKGKPFTFKLGAEEVIKGWEIGVAGMSVGGERRIVVPAHLAYGSKKMADIPPNSTLVFDLKLLEIK